MLVLSGDKLKQLKTISDNSVKIAFINAELYDSDSEIRSELKRIMKKRGNIVFADELGERALEQIIACESEVEDLVLQVNMPNVNVAKECIYFGRHFIGITSDDKKEIFDEKIEKLIISDL